MNAVVIQMISKEWQATMFIYNLPVNRFASTGVALMQIK